MSINYVLSAPALNAGGYKMLQDFNFAALTAEAGVGGATPGMTFWFQGRLFQVIQNRSGGALAVGDVVGLYLADAARTGNLQAASTTAVLKTDDTLDLGLAGDRTYPGYVDVTAGALATTDDMEQHQILGNDNTANNSLITIATFDRSLGPTYGVATLSADALSTTPDATYDYEVICPWEVAKTDADAGVSTAIPQGVVVSTSITDDYFGIIQIKGVGRAKCDGTTDFAAGDLLTPSTTAGVLMLWAPTTTAATLIQLQEGVAVCARAIGPFTDNATGLRGVLLTMPHAIFPNPTF